MGVGDQPRRPPLPKGATMFHATEAPDDEEPQEGNDIVGDPQPDPVIAKIIKNRSKGVRVK